MNAQPPQNELEDYTSKITKPQYETDIKNPATEYERFWNYAREMCRTNLWLLNKCVLITPKRDRTYRKLHKELCDWAQQYINKNKLILMPRKHFKSTLFTVARAIQYLLIDQNCSIMIGNKVHGIAMKFLDEIKQHLESNKILRGLFPDIIPENPMRDSRKWTQEEIYVLTTQVQRNPSVITYGLDSGKTGMAFENAILDDMIDEETMRSKPLLEKTREFLAMMRYLMNPGNVIDFIGTRYGFNDIYAQMKTAVKEGNMDLVIHERRVLEGPQVERCIEELEGKEKTSEDGEEFDALDMTEEIFKGEPIFPENDKGDVEFSKDVLKRDYLGIGGTTKETEVYFWNQMMNFPVEPKTQTFKRAHTKFWNGTGLNDPVFCYIFCDPSLGEGDPCVIMRIYASHDYKLRIAPDIFRETVPPDEIEDKLVEFAIAKQPPSVIVKGVGIEDEAFQRTLQTGLVKKLKEIKCNVPVHGVPTNKRNKSHRILQLQPKHKRGEILYPDCEKMLEILEDEVYRWRIDNKNQLDDCLDCLSQTRYIPQMGGYPPRPEEMKKWRQAWYERRKREKINDMPELNSVEEMMRL